jgi:hypothetical protein
MQTIQTKPETHPAASVGERPECAGRDTIAQRWVKRGGIALFMFFFVKGLVWLGVFAAAGFGLTSF